MTVLYIFSYIVIIGVIWMDRGHELDYVIKTVAKRLEKPYGIQTEITIHKDKTFTVTATKKIGITIKHTSIHSNSLSDALWKLIQYVENDIENWKQKEPY